MSDALESAKTFIGLRKKALEAELLTKEPELMKEYIEACATIERLATKPGISEGEFTPYRSAIDAIIAYLDKVSEFTDHEVVIDALINGGFAPLYKKRRPNIKDSIRYHTERSGKLIIRDGKLGKAEWANGIEG